MEISTKEQRRNRRRKREVASKYSKQDVEIITLALAASICGHCQYDLDEYGNSGVDLHCSCGHYYHTRGLGGGEVNCDAGQIWGAYENIESLPLPNLPKEATDEPR